MTEVWPLPNNGTGLVNNYLENNVQTKDLNAFDIRGDFDARSSRRAVRALLARAP